MPLRSGVLGVARFAAPEDADGRPKWTAVRTTIATFNSRPDACTQSGSPATDQTTQLIYDAVGRNVIATPTLAWAAPKQCPTAWSRTTPPTPMTASTG